MDRSIAMVPVTFVVVPSGLYALFLKEERARRHFLLGKGHPMRKLFISIQAFEGHQGQGNDQGASRQSPSLPP